jgi:hypothetical protein
MVLRRGKYASMVEIEFFLKKGLAFSGSLVYNKEVPGA